MSAPARYHFAIFSRAAAAAAGGYLLGCAVSVGMALLLARGGMTPAGAVIIANTLAFMAYAAAAVWSFACANATRAWIGIAMAAALPAALAVWLQLDLS